jgi:hypothetical protein
MEVRDSEAEDQVRRVGGLGSPCAISERSFEMDISVDHENLLPDPTWDLERLASYAKDRFAIAEFFGRKTAMQLWRAGRALLIVKDKLKAERKWTVWAEEHGLPMTSVYDAIKIAERFEQEDDIVGLTTIEARTIAGTIKPRRADDKGVTNTEPRDERPVTDGGTPATKTGTGSDSDHGDTLDAMTQTAAEGGTAAPTTPAPPDDWFERHREEIRAEMAAIEDNVLVVQEWASRHAHPMSAALLRVLIVAEQITVLLDEGKEVVRVDDHDLIAALALAETVLDPIFTGLGITPEIAARHLLEMVQEGRGIATEPMTPKPKRKTTRSN